MFLAVVIAMMAVFLAAIKPFVIAVYVAAALIAAISILGRQGYWLGLLFLFIVAYSIASHAVHQQQQVVIPAAKIGQAFQMRGTIVSIPKHQGIRTQFLFQSDALYQVSWYGKTPRLHVGQVWQCWFKAKPVHFLQNPQDSDRRWRILATRYQARAYILSRHPCLLVRDSGHWIALWREHMMRLISKSVTKPDLAGIIMALSVGARQHLTPMIWQVFQATGTSHLVAISGLHLGLIASGVFFIFEWLWRRSYFLCSCVPAKRSAALLTIMAVIFYAMIAGMSLPTERAMLMIIVIMLGDTVAWHWRLSDRLGLAFLAILLWQPLAVLSASFWLSFSAVFCIVYVFSGGLKKLSTVASWWRLQLAVSLGLLPLTLWFFHKLSLIQIIANAAAVPWIGFVVVPLCFFAVLLSFLSHTMASYVFASAALGLEPIWWVLQHMAAWRYALLWHTISDWPRLLLLIIGLFWLLAPKGVPLRWVSLLLMLPAFFVSPAKIQCHSVRITVLDVGQGLSVALATSHHYLLYDAGPAFSGGFNAGADVVLPYYRWRGIDHIDRVVISHGDNDHIGGAQAVIDALKPSLVLTSVPKKLQHTTIKPCYAGQHWRWDGVDFRMFSPARGQAYKGNNSSCVLEVTVGNKRILLPGDIEAPIEKALLPDLQPLAVLIAAHHGSASSSIAQFVTATHPKVVIFSTGFFNRFHFPAPKVVQRFIRVGSHLYNTATLGAITMTVDGSGILVQ